MESQQSKLRRVKHALLTVARMLTISKLWLVMMIRAVVAQSQHSRSSSNSSQPAQISPLVSSQQQQPSAP